MSFTNKSYDHLFKLLLIGDSGVGKSAIISRFSDDAFNSNFISTIGIDFKIKTIDLKGRRIKLQIWDTAGQERFHTITTSYYRAAMGIILVYDVTNLQSFENISKWLRNIEVHASEDAEKIILGNKCDADENRVVPTQRGEAIAAEYGVKFLETSAKNDVSIEEAFYYLAGAILTKTMARNDNRDRERDFPQRRSHQQARNRVHDRRSVGFNLKSETNSNSRSEPTPKSNPKSSKCC